MWLFAMFDLPMKTRMQRWEYTRFRKTLLREGFSQFQLSVYARYCVSEEMSVAQSERVKEFLPPEGQVRLLAVTERQFGKQRIYWGPKQKSVELAPAHIRATIPREPQRSATRFMDQIECIRATIPRESQSLIDATLATSGCIFSTEHNMKGYERVGSNSWLG